MRTPRYIATVGSVVLVATVVIASLVTLRGDAVLGNFGVTALESAVLGAFVWPGIYLGARLSTPHQRSDLFTRVLSLTFLAMGILMALPFKTHAIKLDMPSTTHAGYGFDWSEVLLAVVPLALVVVVPFVLTRGLAIALAKVSRP